jgi:2-polyprenyl-3-methyl-5-hydroxy-6-metoxy-1,4-benzoquinol methylase
MWRRYLTTNLLFSLLVAREKLHTGRSAPATMGADFPAGPAAPPGVIRGRAAAYDAEYARWHAKRVTVESYEQWMRFAPDAPGREPGHVNGNEYRLAMQLIGAEGLAGKQVLDCCCGTGLSSIYLALQGAQVSAFDASTRAIRTATESAQLSGVAGSVCFSVMDAQFLAYPARSFDLVYCQSALHIMIDYPRCAGELARVLKPGGRAIFCDEALGHNPLMAPFRWWRRRRWRAHGGRPLRCADLEAFGRRFDRMNIHYFNLLSQVKAFWGESLCSPATKAALRSAHRADEAILASCPWIRPFSGKVVVEYQKSP